MAISWVKYQLISERSPEKISKSEKISVQDIKSVLPVYFMHHRTPEIMLKSSKTYIFGLFFLLMVTSFQLALAGPGHQHSSENKGVNEFSRPEKKVVLISDEQVVPQEIVLSKMDGSVFLLNVSRSSLLTFEIEFGERRPHCASGNLRYDSQRGVLHSIEPVASRDFALLCFPEKGTYRIRISGLRNGSLVKTIEVIVG